MHLLEIATFNVQSALAAAQAGADRIEICDNMFEGGTSPSYGTIKMLKSRLNIPLFAMVRARGGDFFYNDEEFAVMRNDLKLFKELGCDGVVFGFLKADGSVDKEKTSRFCELSYPMEVTFHRAFDRANHPLVALEDIVDCGCQRILTSGQMSVATEAMYMLQQLIKQAAERIIIMPGSGVRSNNIQLVVQHTGATELHSSARLMLPSVMNFTNPHMKEILETVTIDADEIRSMKNVLNRLDPKVSIP